VAALVLGLAGVLLALTPLIGLACGIVGAALAAKARKQAPLRTGMINAAMVLSIIAIVLGGLATLAWAAALAGLPWLQQYMPQFFNQGAQPPAGT
jgi:hypothetical protein